MKDVANVFEGCFAVRASRTMLVWICASSEAREARVKVREGGVLSVDIVGRRWVQIRG